MEAEENENNEIIRVPRGGNIAGTEKGRPKIIISDSQLLLMYKEGFSAREIAQIFGCSTSVVYKLYYERGLKFRNRYSNITSEELTLVIRDLHEQYPNSGTEMMSGYLKSMGLSVQRSKIRETLRLVDPIGCEARKRKSIKRRIYNVPSPNSLWHIDAHCKLIRWGFITHGCIDGYSRLITYAQCTLSASANTVLNLFVPAAMKYGLPSRVRSDHGYENILVAVLMNVLRGRNRGSHIAGRSVHNQRIERLWRDIYIYEYVLKEYHETFFEMETNRVLNPDNIIHRFVLQSVFLTDINRKLKAFVDGWNRHRIRTEKNYSPRKLWLDGLIKNSNLNSTAARGVFVENTDLVQRVRSALEDLNITINEDIINVQEEQSNLRAEINITNEERANFEICLNSYFSPKDKYIAGVRFIEQLLNT